MNLLTIFLAEGEPPTQPQGNMVPVLMMVAVMFAIMWVILIRPQKKERQRREAMIESLQKNAHVVTIGGIHGVVTALRDSDVTIRVDDGRDVKIKITRSAIASVIEKSDDGE